jgi:disulfide bond formation protein DsbB
MAVPHARLLTALAGIVIVLIAVPVGGAVGLAVVRGDAPCILCWAQRTSMALIALTALFVVRYGPRPRYLGTAVLLGAWGTFMALRHSAGHAIRDVGQGFGLPVLGAHTYVWSWVVHWTVLVVIGVLLLLLREHEPCGPREPGRLGRLAMGLFVVVAGANALQAFASTGPPPFLGQSDPVRFSWNPRHWVWSLEEWKAGPMSWRGTWGVAPPDLAALDTDPARGPLAELPVLGVRRRVRIEPPLAGRVTGLDRDAASGRFLLATDRYEVVVLDSSLTRAEHRVVLDAEYSVDLSPLAGAAFLGDTLALLATNKSYVLLRAGARAEDDRAWRMFRETSGGIVDLRRSRFATVRARQMLVHTLAFDPASDELITLSVPSARHRRLVVSRFSRGDLLLSAEFVPGLAEGVRVAAPDRSLADYVVTGATVADSLLYAVSAAYSTLLVLDLRERIVRAAYAVPGLREPTGLASRAGDLLIAEADGGVVVVERPRPPYARPAPSRCSPPSPRDC